MNATENGTKFDINAAQVRAGRALLGWSQDQLAECCAVSKRTLVRFELEETIPQRRTRDTIRAALEAAGVVFIEENGHGPGVRLRKEKQ